MVTTVPFAASGIGVSLTRVSLRLGGRDVLERITLDLAPGAHALLVGANGAGKSQLLKLLAGQRWPTARPGSTCLYHTAGGQTVQLRDVRERLQLVSAEQQDRYERYGWNFTVAAIVGTGCRGLDAPLGPLNAAERDRTQRCLRLMGLEPLRRRRFLSLSYGERRLTLIARALAAQPGLLLLDEVYNGLDARHRRRLDRVLERLCGTPLTIVVSAHRAEDAAAGFTQAFGIVAGRLRYAGPRTGLPMALAGHLPGRAIGDCATAGQRGPAPAAGSPLLSLHNASIYRDYRIVLKNLNWTISAGEHWAILGRNGSGKSSLLQAIYGSLPVADGATVVRRGHARGEPIELWQARVRLVTPDDHTACLSYPTLEHVVLSGWPRLRRLKARPTSAQRRVARSALRRVGIGHLAAHEPRAVSYGQLRLALLARALAGSPQALLLDEPLTGLDAAMRNRVRAVLEEVADAGVQLVVAAHHADDLIAAIDHTLTLPGARRRLRVHA